VAEDERCTGVADEFGANQESLCNSLRFWLLGVIDLDTKLCAVSQVTAEHRQIFRRRDKKDFAESAQHQGRQWIANHGLVVNRKKLFADDFCEWKETRPGAACEENSLLIHRFVFDLFLRYASSSGPATPTIPSKNSRV